MTHRCYMVYNETDSDPWGRKFLECTRSPQPSLQLNDSIIYIIQDTTPTRVSGFPCRFYYLWFSLSCFEKVGFL